MTMAVLQSYAHVWEARLAKDALASHGIVAVIQADSQGATTPLMAISEKPVRLLVDEHGFQNAFEVLREWSGWDEEDSDEGLHDNEPTAAI
jgi:hypothetical protein